MWVAACAPDWSDKLPSKAAEQLKLEPDQVAQAASRAVTVRSSSPDKPRLFALSLSESQLKSVRRGELSKAVSEHEVELYALPNADLAPTDGQFESSWAIPGLLAPNTSYTVVAANTHLKFVTKASEPALRRVWPKTEANDRVVYCAEVSTQPPPLAANPEQLWGGDRLWFAPEGKPVGDAGGERASPWQLLGGETPCYLWHASSLDVAPPTHWNGFAIEGLRNGQGGETPVAGSSVGPNGSAPERTCLAHDVVTEHACLTVEDDRIIVRPTAVDTLFLVEGDVHAWFVSEQGEPGVVRGLQAESELQLTLYVFQASGVSAVHDLIVHTKAPAPHVVINEVLADPLGSEPQGEWVEVYNDGAAVVDLEGWALEDDGGKVELPASQLAPFGYALLVNDTYAAASDLDVVPDEDVFLIRLPSLGKSGLSNQGEALRLSDKSGKVVSSFPASPKPLAGVSVARREPWFVGAPSRAFGLHAAPFASPGKRNAIRSE